LHNSLPVQIDGQVRRAVGGVWPIASSR